MLRQEWQDIRLGRAAAQQGQQRPWRLIQNCSHGLQQCAKQAYSPSNRKVDGEECLLLYNLIKNVLI